jgi:hypothetical protein
MSGIVITRTGVEEVVGRLERLRDFQKIARQPVQDALDVFAGAQKSGIKRGPTGKGQGSIGTHIHTAKWGVYGNAGPRGGRFREGFLAALFLNSGTGLQGPLRHKIVAKRVLSFTAYGSSIGAGSLFGSRFGAKANPSTKSRGQYKQQRFGSLGKVFARSTVGMRAQPWAKAARGSEGRARSAFEEALTKGIAEANRG